MITEKFIYAPLNRETINGSRKYATPDGEKLPSVTTILDFTKPEEKKKAPQINTPKTVGFMNFGQEEKESGAKKK